MNHIIYKPTTKAIKRGALEPTDRLIFTKSNEAICFDVETRKVIEPWMRKTIDSHVMVDTTASANDLVIPEAVMRMYRGHMTALVALAEQYNIQLAK
jgi:hypothetical protein